MKTINIAYNKKLVPPSFDDKSMFVHVVYICSKIRTQPCQKISLQLRQPVTVTCCLEHNHKIVLPRQGCLVSLI